MTTPWTGPSNRRATTWRGLRATVTARGWRVTDFLGNAIASGPECVGARRLARLAMQNHVLTLNRESR